MLRLILAAFIFTPSLARADCTDLSTIGSAVAVRITAPGDGYTDPAVTLTPPPEPGVAATAAAMFTTGHGLSEISLDSGGDGYVDPPKVTITDPTGTGATAEVAEMQYTVIRSCRF